MTKLFCKIEGGDTELGKWVRGLSNLTPSCVILKNSQIYFKGIEVFTMYTPEIFKVYMFNHFSTLCMKVLKY